MFSDQTIHCSTVCNITKCKGFQFQTHMGDVRERLTVFSILSASTNVNVTGQRLLLSNFLEQG